MIKKKKKKSAEYNREHEASQDSQSNGPPAETVLPQGEKPNIAKTQHPAGDMAGSRERRPMRKNRVILRAGRNTSRKTKRRVSVRCRRKQDKNAPEMKLKMAAVKL